VSIKTISVWGAVALVVVVMVAALLPSDDAVRRATELSYSDMLERVEAGEAVEARTKGSMILLRTRDARDYVIYVPDGTMADTVRQLNAAGVNVRATPPLRGPTLGDIILGLLPMLLLIGSVYFFMRLMQAKAQVSGK
jgi:cell division protease FtsH